MAKLKRSGHSMVSEPQNWQKFCVYQEAVFVLQRKKNPQCKKRQTVRQSSGVQSGGIAGVLTRAREHYRKEIRTGRTCLTGPTE